MPNEKRVTEQKFLASRHAIRVQIRETTFTNEKMTAEEIENWLAIRKEAAFHIDPETAEVEWICELTVDPYPVHSGIPEKYQQVGREYFARSPGSDVWVDFGYLPEATIDALWERHYKKLAFPAGLSL